MKKYCGLLLALCLMFSTAALGQERDTLLIHFDSDRSRLRADALAAMDSAVSIYRSNSRLAKISLAGHCDSTGGYAYNDRLSESRIRAVRDYLRSRGIADSLFRQVQGYGKRRPLNDNGDAYKRSLNRRVEIVVEVGPGGIPVAGPPGGSNPGVPVAAVPTPGLAAPVQAPSLTLSEFFRDSAQLGKTYILRNLNFIAGRHVLMPYSDTVLKELLRIMLDSPGLKIEIRGHVCCIAEFLDGLDFDTNTEDLSVRRARYVYDYLRQGGVKASRMSYRGYGASQKLYHYEQSEQEEEANRRVEIKSIKRKNPQD